MIVNQDKHYKWFLSIVLAATCIIIVIIWKYPDIVKANASKDTKLGEYVYVDTRTILHVSRKCPKLNYKGWKSQRVKLVDIFTCYKDELRDLSICPHCVDDKDYEKIVSYYLEQRERERNECWSQDSL